MFKAIDEKPHGLEGKFVLFLDVFVIEIVVKPIAKEFSLMPFDH